MENENWEEEWYAKFFSDEFKPCAYFCKNGWETVEIELSSDNSAVKYRVVSRNSRTEWDNGYHFAEVENDYDIEPDDEHYGEQFFETKEGEKYYLCNFMLYSYNERR